MLYKTQGIIIKRTNLGEVDRLLTVYTKDFGKILVRAKSVRRSQSKLKGHLELFLHSHLSLAPGKNLDIITGAETIERFSGLHQQLPYLATAYYLSEVIDKSLAGPEKDEQIWQLILSSFYNLDQEKMDVKILIANFQRKLSGFLGYGESQSNEEIYAKAFLQKALDLLR